MNRAQIDPSNELDSDVGLTQTRLTQAFQMALAELVAVAETVQRECNLPDFAAANMRLTEAVTGFHAAVAVEDPDDPDEPVVVDAHAAMRAPLVAYGIAAVAALEAGQVAADTVQRAMMACYAALEAFCFGDYAWLAAGGTHPG
jgi:hypothetical protein